MKACEGKVLFTSFHITLLCFQCCFFNRIPLGVTCTVSEIPNCSLHLVCPLPQGRLTLIALAEGLGLQSISLDLISYSPVCACRFQLEYDSAPLLGTRGGCPFGVCFGNKRSLSTSTSHRLADNVSIEIYFDSLHFRQLVLHFGFGQDAT